MPHIIFDKFKKDLVTPSKKEGITFNFIAKSYNFTKKERASEYRVCVTNENKDFLLTLKTKDENYLIKAEKVTRIAPTKLIKDALNSYVQEIDANIIFSNTHNFSHKIEPAKKYLKSINYFVDDFKTEKEIQIEIGFGSGRHLLHQAKNNPNIQFIGLEIHTPSIEQVLRQIKIQELDNILVVNYDARLFMEFIESNKVGKIFVHFPVPWDKKPHRRIYSSEFIKEALRALKLKGTLELRTDSRKYFDYCIQLLINLNSGRIIIDINKNLEISSKYEDRWEKQGKNIYDMILICNQEDEKINLDFDFSFPDEINFEELIKNISTKSLVRDNYFVHIEDIFIIENKENSGLLQVTFGNFDRPVSKYIIIKNNKAVYFQDLPIPTSSNIKAHNELKEMLK